MSSSAAAASAPAAAPTHGYDPALKNLPAPTCVVKDDNLARPDYNAVSTRSEYVDSRAVLEAKAELLLGMMRRSKAGCPFLGAGISVTSADTYTNSDRRINPRATGEGCTDYASGKTSSVARRSARLTMNFIDNVMRPTPAHRVLAQLFRQGIWQFPDCLSQNHDYLLHRAGVPKEHINELHGCWHESQRESNPVVPMSGQLRGDLFERCLESERTADMCLSLGSSHSGLNCDRIPKSVGQRHKAKGKGEGLAICSLQATTLDSFARLRVWARLDEFMMIVAEKAGLLDAIDWDTDYLYEDATKTRKFRPEHRHVYVADYFAARGRQPPAGTPAVVLQDLAPKIAAAAAAMAKPAAAAAAAATATDAAAPATVAGGVASVAAPAAAAARSIVAEPDAATAASNARPAAPAAAAAAAAPAPAASSYAATAATSVTVGNYHELASATDSNSHRWCVFVRAPRGLVKAVTFHLHPTFTPAEVRVDSAFVDNAGNEEFRLQRLGWGTFPVGCAIELTAGGKTLKATHELSFAAPETSRVVFQR